MVPYSEAGRITSANPQARLLTTTGLGHSRLLAGDVVLFWRLLGAFALVIATIATDIATRDEVMAALSRLPPDFRAAIVLREYAGLSYQEISQQTGLAVSAIGTTLARARRRLVETIAAGTPVISSRILFGNG